MPSMSHARTFDVCELLSLETGLLSSAMVGALNLGAVTFRLVVIIGGNILKLL